MFHRSALGLFAVATMLTVTAGGAQAQDKKYPNWKGEWDAVVPRMPGQQLRFDPTKPYGRRQEAPLTEEYKKVYQENLEEQARGGQGLFLDHASCLPAGMPTMMSIGRFEYIITPETTYVATGSDLRRIFTDGRPWPTDLESTYQGFSMGKGPRVYDSTGIPLHFDNESTLKERIFLDKKDPNILHDVITVFDHALTQPWTVDKTYRRGATKFPNWSTISCLEGSSYVKIAKEFYLLSWDGYLMPIKKGQPPPDPRYFPKAQK
jgi:hypothetical protein